jgi:hypothetical protein
MNLMLGACISLQYKLLPFEADILVPYLMEKAGAAKGQAAELFADLQKAVCELYPPDK